jgi:uncharacterized protein with FMN-binding domain
MRRVILAICATAAALVLLLSFKTHSQQAPLGTAPASAIGSRDPGSTGASPAPAAKSAKPASSAAPAAAARTGSGAGTGGIASRVRTFTGDTEQTIYGPVQVRITVTAGKITGVSAVQYPEDTPRDYEINAYAIPQLNAETLAAGSAGIDSVSGATYTSQGYISSLQSAIDKAGR